MEIVFFESSTIDYGDIDFSVIEKYGNLTMYRTTEPDQVIERCRNADVVITNKVVIDERVMDAAPKLKLIAEAATGYNNIDIVAAFQRNIAVTNVPGYSTSSVAQLTMTFILALASNLLKYNEAAHDGEWSRSQNFTMGNWPFIELEGSTVGIMGYGAIGKEVARRCKTFGMDVIALQRGESDVCDVERVMIDELARRSDYITIHMPLTGYSKHIVNSAFIDKMKKTACIINIARGPIIDQTALLQALTSGRIAGAALDVMEIEPPPADEPLLMVPNLIITPHKGWAGHRSRRRLVNEVAENIRVFLEGGRRNRVEG